jgi:hypothetical protein
MVFPATLKQTLSESFDYNGKLLSFDASGFISPQNKLGGARYVLSGKLTVHWVIIQSVTTPRLHKRRRAGTAISGKLPQEGAL